MGGQCERHQLPLDAHGECELCRLSAIPSNPPRSRSVSWLAVGGAVLLAGGAVFAFRGASKPQAAPSRGVPQAASQAERGVRRPPTPPTPRQASAGERPTSIPTPPRPEERRVVTAPMPPRPPTTTEQREFTEDDARAALEKVRIEMYATSWCGSCRRARAYLQDNGIAYTEYDIDADESAKDRLAEMNPRKSIPTFQIDDIVQIGFSPESLEYKLNQAVRARLYE